MSARGLPAQHADQGALADAAAAEDAEPLAAAAGDESVDGANATTQRLPYGNALQRTGRRTFQRPFFLGQVTALLVQRRAHGVDHPPQHVLSDAQSRPHVPGDNAVAVADTRRFVQRHGQHGRAAEAYDFSGIRLLVGGDNGAGLPYGTRGTFRFDEVSQNLGDAAFPAQAAAILQPLVEAGQAGVH